MFYTIFSKERVQAAGYLYQEVVRACTKPKELEILFDCINGVIYSVLKVLFVFSAKNGRSEWSNIAEFVTVAESAGKCLASSEGETCMTTA